MKKIYIHIILITIFLLIPILSSPDLDSHFSMLQVPMFQKDFLQMVLLIAFFYFNYLFLIPKIFNPKKYFLFVFLIAFIFGIILLIPEFSIGNQAPETFPNPNNGMNTPPNMPEKGIELNVFRLFFPFSFAFLCSFFWFKSNEKRELETAKEKAELLNLKYQLQPHFLFNILNSIYSLALIKSDDAPNGILKLSNVMRYVVSESGEDFVSLPKEIEYIKDYIALQLIRTDESLDFSYTETGSPENLKIAPLILVNFVENAFKYGFNAEENSKINLDIGIENKIMHFHIFNLKVNKSITDKTSTKIGIKNTLQRLKQIYPEKHQIKITENEETYEVDLQINLS